MKRVMIFAFAALLSAPLMSGCRRDTAEREPADDGTTQLPGGLAVELDKSLLADQDSVGRAHQRELSEASGAGERPTAPQPAAGDTTGEAPAAEGAGGDAGESLLGGEEPSDAETDEAPAATGDTSAAAADGDTAEPPAGDTGPDIDAAKRIVTQILTAAGGNNPTGSLQHFTQEDQRIISPLVVQAPQLPGRIETYKNLVTGRLGLEMPADFEEQLAMVPGAGGDAPNPAEKLATASVDDYRFERTDDGVMATPTGRQGPKLLLSETNGRWAASLPADERRMLSLFANLVQGVSRYLSVMNAGIETGGITAENFGARQQELAAEFVEPALKPLADMMQGMTEEAMQGAAEGMSGEAEPNAPPADDDGE